MASADLRDELDCSICLNIYTDPVTLRCGHNFCRVCIDHVLDTQEGCGVYTCPESRAEFQDCPVLENNRKLCNIAEHVRSIPEEETEIFCSFCVQSPVPALKTCLWCEASLCDIHCKTHNKSAKHVLIDPTTSSEKRKCFIHDEILKYFCTEDTACICVSCSLSGEHQGHLVEMLDVASEKKKEKLRNVLQNLTTKREETEKRVQSLQERRREDQEKATDVIETVTALFKDIRRQLDDLEKRVLSEISKRKEFISLSVSDLIQHLKTKKDDLSRKMRHIEELCKMSDPVTVLQEPDTGDLCDDEELSNMTETVTVVQEEESYSDISCNTEEEDSEEGDSEVGDCEEGDTEDRERHDDQVHDVGDLDVGLISGKLHTLSDIITGINVCFNVQEATDILLDVNTACKYIHISGNKKIASWSDKTQKRQKTPERFHFPQVISTRRFSSGRHYWEVDVSKSWSWMVGMCYPSIDRRGAQSYIGDNNKSWCLDRNDDEYTVLHDRKEIWLPDNIPYDRVRIYLDYEAGQLSFYSLCDPIRHLHTITATFTEPLHAALGVWDGCIEILGGVQSTQRPVI